MGEKWIVKSTLGCYFGIGNIRDGISWNFTVITFLLYCYCFHSYQPFMKIYSTSKIYLYNFFIPQFFLASFQPSSKLPRHACGLFASHMRSAAHRLKMADLERSAQTTTPCVVL